MEIYKLGEFAKVVGHPPSLIQVNRSIFKAGMVYGIYFAKVPPNQAKYMTCLRGAVLDFTMDVRAGPPTFRTWDSMLLGGERHRAIYLSEGLRYCLVVLEDDSIMTYLCSEGYNPGREHGVSPVDPEVGLVFPDKDLQGQPLEVLLSEKDTAAPSLAEARKQGLLPEYQATLGYITSPDQLIRAS